MEEKTVKIDVESAESNPTGADQQTQTETVDQNSASGEQDVALLMAELAEQKDKYLRLYADFDNFKKRSLKEKIDTIRNASQELIQDVLVVLDDFDRAKKIAIEQKNDNIYPEGMQLVHHKLLGILQSKGLEEMDPTGKPFDAEFHEAITEIPVTESSLNGKVIDTIEKAYLLNQKVTRFAKVIVGKQ